MKFHRTYMYIYIFFVDIYRHIDINIFIYIYMIPILIYIQEKSKSLFFHPYPGTIRFFKRLESKVWLFNLSDLRCGPVSLSLLPLLRPHVQLLRLVSLQILR